MSACLCDARAGAGRCHCIIRRARPISAARRAGLQHCHNASRDVPSRPAIRHLGAKHPADLQRARRPHALPPTEIRPAARVRHRPNVRPPFAFVGLQCFTASNARPPRGPTRSLQQVRPAATCASIRLARAQPGGISARPEEGRRKQAAKAWTKRRTPAANRASRTAHILDSALCQITSQAHIADSVASSSDICKRCVSYLLLGKADAAFLLLVPK